MTIMLTKKEVATMTPASQRTRALSEPEAKRREKARLLVRQFRAQVGALLQEFRAKFG
jgi:hypothetical protein